MGAGAGNAKAPSSEELAPEQEATVKAAKQWVHQLARTIKSCRLYQSPTNPVVQRAQSDLAGALQRLLEEHRVLVLRFTSDDILTEGTSLYPARSREDNLALPFYRDGIRKITFSPGVQPAELATLVGAIMQVTGPSRGEDDLVTLFWQAQLTHVEVEYVPAEAEMGGDSMGPGSSDAGGPGFHGSGGSGSGPGGPGLGDGGDGGGDGSLFSGAVEGDAGAYGPIAEEAQGVPWPQWTDSSVGALRLDQAPAEGQVTETGPGRSDDWQVESDTVEVEADFEELDLTAAPELEAFRFRLEAERQVSPVSAAIELSRAILAAGEGPDDRIDLARFIPRVIREAAAKGEWRQAGAALTLLEECQGPASPVDVLAKELCHPSAMASAAAAFEALEPAQVEDFIAFTQRLGDWAIDLLGLMLAEVGESRYETRLIDAISDECRDSPERLAPWLDDPRWIVVRNTVRMLGRIGGDSIAGLLQAVAEHEEQAVRDEVVVALKGVTPALAKPLLIRLLDDADTPTFCSVVQQLGQVRDAEVAKLALEYLTHPEFERQPVEERRAICSAVASAGANDVLPRLEAELHKGTWLNRSNDAYRREIAACIGQIGTPQAKQVLQRGARSPQASLRLACHASLARFGKS